MAIQNAPDKKLTLSQVRSRKIIFKKFHPKIIEIFIKNVSDIPICRREFSIL